MLGEHLSAVLLKIIESCLIFKNKNAMYSLLLNLNGMLVHNTVSLSFYTYFCRCHFVFYNFLFLHLLVALVRVCAFQILLKLQKKPLRTHCTWHLVKWYEEYIHLGQNLSQSNRNTKWIKMVWCIRAAELRLCCRW